ncbi:hypothetical protein [Psychrobacillus sp. FSL K6-1415]|uniref:hypothetical protein n=1 Tax=Psychrobacillus sp. FSL K6-1415 TaxID=2921544 RepID=UPI0030FACD70
MISTARKEIFKDLRQQIFDKSKWKRDHFSVYNYEAGLGKSMYAQELMAESSERILYVQRFSKNNALEVTVNRINKIAGENVAVAYTGEDTRKKRIRKKKLEARVLCITHKMYIQICRGNHQDLLSNRKILIIDEYPDLIEQIKIGKKEIGQLFIDIFHYGNTDGLALRLRELLHKYSHDSEMILKKEMKFVDFSDLAFRKYAETINQIIDEVVQKGKGEDYELLFKFQQLLKKGAYFYHGSFHTIDSTIKFSMLECNIILDANGGFDYRYNLSKKFKVIHQEKYLDYSQAELYHYELNTSKRSILSYLNLTETILKKINFSECKGILFVTEKEQVENVKMEIEGYFDENFEDIQTRLSVNLSVGYFGALTGINDFRLYDKVVILKTPNFNYETYVMNNFIYNSFEGIPNENIPIFENKAVETIRLSTVAGEIYQAIRRIARDSPGEAQIHIVNDNQEIINTILEQMPCIQYSKHQIHVLKSKNDRERQQEHHSKKKLNEKRLEEAKKLIIEAQQSGKLFIKKKDIRSMLGINQSPNFTLLLNELSSFLHDKKVINEGQKLIFR